MKVGAKKVDGLYLNDNPSFYYCYLLCVNTHPMCHASVYPQFPHFSLSAWCWLSIRNIYSAADVMKRHRPSFATWIFVYRSTDVINTPNYRSLLCEIYQVYRSFIIFIKHFEVSNVRILQGQQKFVPFHQSSFLIWGKEIEKRKPWSSAFFAFL